MNDLEFCIATRRREAPAFARVLRAMPQDRLDYQPEPRSRTAAALAWTIVCEETALVSLLDTGTMEWPAAKPPATVEEFAATYEKSAAEVDARLSKLDEAGWRKGGRFPWAAGTTGSRRSPSSSGCSCSTASTTAASSAPTCGRWAARCRRSTALPRTTPDRASGDRLRSTRENPEAFPTTCRREPDRSVTFH